MNAVKDKIPELVEEELKAANAQYPPFHSLHEGYAVMLEEVEETAICQRKIEETMKGIWTYTKCDRDGETVSGWAKRVKQHAMHAACEAIQVAAMAQKMMDYIGEGEEA